METHSGILPKYYTTEEMKSRKWIVKNTKEDSFDYLNPFLMLLLLSILYLEDKKKPQIKSSNNDLHKIKDFSQTRKNNEKNPQKFKNNKKTI